MINLNSWLDVLIYFLIVFVGALIGALIGLRLLSRWLQKRFEIEYIDDGREAEEEKVIEVLHTVDKANGNHNPVKSPPPYRGTWD